MSPYLGGEFLCWMLLVGSVGNFIFRHIAISHRVHSRSKIQSTNCIFSRNYRISPSYAIKNNNREKEIKPFGLQKRSKQSSHVLN